MTETSTRDTTEAELDRVLESAAEAAEPFGALAPRDRAAVLRAVSGAVDASADELVPIAQQETRLAEARLRGELARTGFQLRLFADVLDDGGYLEAAIDGPDPDWPVGPRPDLRRVLEPIGPVVVFGASNFPFAFSVIGGDSASALAAGNPVVVKAHPGHPELSVRTGEIVAGALREAGAPTGTFAVVLGEETGRRAVVHPRTRAVGFTGSIPGGRALHDLAAGRPDPIPFYGELGSTNPVFVTRAAAAARGESLFAEYADSFTLGAGQFCTKPGVLLLPEGAALEPLAEAVRRRPAAALLNERIERGFTAGLRSLADHPAVEVLVEGGPSDDTVDTDGADGGTAWTPSLVHTSARRFLEHLDDLLEERFGPVSLVVTYSEESELLGIADALPGQLTATVHGEESDGVAAPLLDRLRRRAGRVLWNGWPTGVSVTHAMHHGGPYPATTSVLHTSVGGTAIRRFLRPVCYQQVPQHLLPEVLRDGNPLDVPRRVNGELRLP
ncbi:NADP-dependent aldehyde dehydrogenase [Spinactinospora alkalitolerans]|uniref:NADP-dependent aldehyde dehydrogenase n=1 Tax=Spinactinospora alkalitolerans TaxID=687207 RepID=A0A852U0Q3_9ACTN|nr:aldehyde dehydrogenase (NADP(+)) [Spinactinospora alkalitolerans]NYE47774.1 NADP-dependent aldehyde dehydrogenase [Spinactinospora alkalitolerans]